MAWPELLLNLLAFVVMAIGLVGIVLPFLPAGIPLVWFGVFLSGVGSGFTRVDIPFLALMGVLALLAFVLEYWSMRWSIRKPQVTPFAVLGAVVGGFIGSAFGLLPGLTVGPLLGAVLGEMLTGRDSVFVLETNAFKIIGFVGTTLMKITIGVTMIGLWIAQLV